MGYNALEKMREINKRVYGIADSVAIPNPPACFQNFGCEALAFVRDDCEDLKFDSEDSQRIALNDSDGRSAGANSIPYNMERDLDRLCFEAAIGRFLESGSREDAFDVYYCYCEIFKPFGSKYDSANLLLQMLSEHETNASSLLMKHRDHYSHSVYVFLIGLAIYRNLSAVRNAYNQQYGLEEGRCAACHFLENWGLTSLFHDIGYPFEIAHQQMKSYICRLYSDNNDDNGFAPHVSYRLMHEFADCRLGDLNRLYARGITERLARGYLDRTSFNAEYLHRELLRALRDRAVHENPIGKDYLFMDHAYFSGLIAAKSFLESEQGIPSLELIPEEKLDCFTAIILHNSLFRFTIRALLDTKEPLKLSDGQPLAYLLMLCDELQCWDRASYGIDNRKHVYPFDFDIDFTDGKMRWTYYFDSARESDVLGSSTYRACLASGYSKKSGVHRNRRSKFMDDIDEVVDLTDVLPFFERDVSKPDESETIEAVLKYRQKKTGVYLSDSNYLNLYHFALALHARYYRAENDAEVTEEDMLKLFEDGLSLEYKLSNIAQAKGFARLLESINCFYTDRPVEYEPLLHFEQNELDVLAEAEHERWCKEKLSLGWTFGTDHVGALESGRNDNRMRDRTRRHHDLTPFVELDHQEQMKDSEPMKLLLEKLREFEGLTIYRMWPYGSRPALGEQNLVKQ